MTKAILGNSICPKCRRPVAVKTIDHCLFCGEQFPLEMCMTSEDKEWALDKQRLEREARKPKPSKRLMYPNNGDDWFDFFDGD